MTDLKPCPFCGGEAECHQWWSATISGDYATFCTKCGCGTDYYKTKAEAIAAWNARAERGTLTAEQVREAVKRHASFDYGEIGAYVSGENWQAIADELNARAERTCRSIDPIDSREFFICSNCNFGAGRVEFIPNYCPNCGAKVVGA